MAHRQSNPVRQDSRKIPERAVDKVAASIKEFGWRQPIVVDKDGVIIIGHVRRLAAKQLNLTEVPVHVAENLTPAQVKALRLMDNRSHEETDWDLELLGPELEELQSLDFDLDLTGFDPHEIEDFVADPDLDERANVAPQSPRIQLRSPAIFGNVASIGSCAATQPTETSCCSSVGTQNHSYASQISPSGFS